ncbi:putative calcium-binding protein CML19 [Curcuma longa]|uniref:putative calcium-binding protein CML19 n=1 Tax=Curcuma longa TaxID=136217 RepID=UPI003D9F503A
MSQRKKTIGLLCCLQVDVDEPSPAARSSSTSSSGKGRRRDRVQELLEVFRHFDRDGDGKISAAELLEFFVSIGEAMGEDEAAEAVAELDVDGDGKLDFGDFARMMVEGAGTEEEEMRRVFGAFESAKGSGRIDAAGLRRTLSRLGEDRSVAECEAMIQAFDLDGDGELDFHEFNLMMT